MAQVYGKRVTLNGSVQQLTALVTNAPTNYVKSVQIQAGSANAGVTYLGTATMTATTDGYSFLGGSAAQQFSGGDSGVVDLSKIYLLGTNNDVVWVSYVL